MKHTFRRRIGLRTVTALIMALSFLLASVMPVSAGIRKSSVDNSTIPYDATITTNNADWKKFAVTEEEEGITLLKNKNGTLPMKAQKINLLGFCAYHPIYSGTGSGEADTSVTVSLTDSLEKAGFELNPAIGKTEGYAKEPEKSLIDQVTSVVSTTFKQYEPSLGNFTGDASFENMKKYSDTAVIVLGRNAGENDDLTAYESVDGRRYLQLSVNEEALLKKARATFDTVIVLLNTSNAPEMKELAKIDVDAIVDFGLPGTTAMSAVPEVLTGKVNPSGRLVDTWVYDNDANPSSANFGNQHAVNAKQAFYVDYVEGIYNGYKYYETAAAEKAKITDPKTGKIFDFGDYDKIVAYPFGTGLSYTTFTQEYKGGIPKNLKADDSFDVKVKVTNTGDVAGKEAVQLYVTVPYTSYDEKHNVEKAEVSLIGIAKTKKLAPGKSQALKIHVNMEDIASYDNTYKNADGTKGAYRLDKGDYTFSIRENSHVVIDSKTSVLKDTHVFSGEDRRKSDDQQAYNQFDPAARGKYLSRKDGFANYAEAMNSVSNKIKDLTFQNDPDAYNAKYDKDVTTHYVKGVNYAKPGDLQYTDLKGVPYDDPKWDELVAQLTIPEMQRLTTWGIYMTASAKSVGKPFSLDSDGPQGMASFVAGSGIAPVAYPAQSTIAMSFNPDLAYRYGQIIADELHFNGATSWYAPAMDNHRNAYSGRNYEYYSEDAYLSGIMGSKSTLGAREKGTIVFIKHFALNDQETFRGSNLHTYSNEQAIREIYLKPFEMSVKEGHANAVMGACNMIGDVFANDYEPLMVEVLRNEWGFRGQVSSDQCMWGVQYNPGDSVGITDYWLHSDALLRGGSDFWLSIPVAQSNVLTYPSAKTDADIYYMQRAAKNILYTHANAYVIPLTTENVTKLVSNMMG